MNYLLDTHIFLWMLFEPGKFSDPVREILEDNSNSLFVSAVSFWEINLKARLGKVSLPEPDLAELLDYALKSGVLPVDLTASHCATFSNLPNVTGHKDPFDRMLIHQCIELGYVLISADPLFDKYRDFGLVLIQN
jgi:PIN domain nuclease of toxin-antitoxin system